jgi:uncharacterized membrane protein
VAEKSTDRLWGCAASSGSSSRPEFLARHAGAGDTLVARSVTIKRPRQELYDFWRDFRNLPLFIENIKRVSVTASVLSG